MATPHPHVVANMRTHQEDLAKGGSGHFALCNVVDGSHAKAQLGVQLLGFEQGTVEDQNG